MSFIFQIWKLLYIFFIFYYLTQIRQGIPKVNKWPLFEKFLVKCISLIRSGRGPCKQVEKRCCLLYSLSLLLPLRHCDSCNETSKCNESTLVSFWCKQSHVCVWLTLLCLCYWSKRNESVYMRIFGRPVSVVTCCFVYVCNCFRVSNFWYNIHMFIRLATWNLSPIKTHILNVVHNTFIAGITFTCLKYVTSIKITHP